MPDNFKKDIKYREGDVVVHDEYGDGIIQEYDPEQEYVRVQFSNDNLIDLHVSEIKQTSTLSTVNIKSTSNVKLYKNSENEQDLDESIIFALKSIDSRRCKIDNIYKKVLIFRSLKARGNNRKKYYHLIDREISKLIKKSIIKKYNTQHGIWVKLEDCYENYLKKKNKEKNNQQLPLFAKDKKILDIKQKDVLLNNEELDPGIIYDEDFLGFSIPDPDDLIESESATDTSHINIDTDTQPSKIEAMLGLNQICTASDANDTNNYSLDLKINSIVTMLNSMESIFASKDVNTINIKINGRESSFDIIGRIDRFNENIYFVSYLDYDERYTTKILSISGGHHFSSIIGIQLQNGINICMTVRKTIYSFTPTESSFKLLVNMIDDLRQIVSALREKQ